MRHVAQDGATITDRGRAWLDPAKLVGAFTEAVQKAFAGGLSEADAPHLEMTGDVLRQHLADAHYKDRALLADAKDATMAKAHVAAHNVAESVTELELTTNLVPLTERKLRADGTVPIKVIAPGWGTSGYYSAAVLERDAPKVFAKGTKMYLDHPTPSEEAARPERSVRDLAAEFVSDARWNANGPDGPGVYADAKVIGPFRETLPELAPHIGVSIRALGRAKQGQAEGRTGALVEQLVAAKSVDFVTQAGAGGKVLQLMESARARAAGAATQHEEDEGMADATELAEAKKTIADYGTKLARLQEQAVLREAVEMARGEIGRSDLPDITKARLVETVSKSAPLKDGELDAAAFKTLIEAAVKSEREYVAKLFGTGQIRGMGSAPADGKERDYTKELAEAFRDMGHDDKTAAALAAGRN